MIFSFVTNFWLTITRYKCKKMVKKILAIFLFLIAIFLIAIVLTALLYYIGVVSKENAATMLLSIFISLIIGEATGYRLKIKNKRNR